jgi:hypothetical protein
MCPDLRPLRGRMLPPRSRALQTLRGDVRRMCRGLPNGDTHCAMRTVNGSSARRSTPAAGSRLSGVGSLAAAALQRTAAECTRLVARALRLLDGTSANHQVMLLGIKQRPSDLDRPNHCPAVTVWLGDYCIVRDDQPIAFKANATSSYQPGVNHQKTSRTAARDKFLASC